MNKNGPWLQVAFSNDWKKFRPIFQSLEISEEFFPRVGKMADSYQS
jgi:hypothetical protein